MDCRKIVVRAEKGELVRTILKDFDLQFYHFLMHFAQLVDCSSWCDNLTVSEVLVMNGAVAIASFERELLLLTMRQQDHHTCLSHIFGFCSQVRPS
jgi:hypothetical protein